MGDMTPIKKKNPLTYIYTYQAINVEGLFSYSPICKTPYYTLFSLIGITISTLIQKYIFNSWFIIKYMLH